MHIKSTLKEREKERNKTEHQTQQIKKIVTLLNFKRIYTLLVFFLYFLIRFVFEIKK